MTKSDKIREHFLKHKNASIYDVAVKYDASRPLVYKIRKQVADSREIAPALPVKATEEIKKFLEEFAAVAVSPVTKVDDVLDSRAKDYGKFKDGAALMQSMKRLIADHAAKHDKTFSDDQWEALEMIVHKVGRIVNGNPDKVDNWVDIAGYATLVADRLQGNAR